MSESNAPATQVQVPVPEGKESKPARPAQKAEDDGLRVFVGNLDAEVTEDQVREILSKAGGEITEIALPSRMKRPSGYAFATYKSKEQAQKVVDELNGTEVGERKLALEIARTKAESDERRQATIDKRKASKTAAIAAKKEKAKAAAAEAGETAVPAEGQVEIAEGETKPKKKRKSSRKKKSARRIPEEGEEAVETEVAATSQAPKPKAKRERKPKEARIDEEAGEEKKKEPRAPKPRNKTLEPTGESSKTTIFVGNLPFSMDDETLAALFTDLSIRVKSAHVVKGVRKGRTEQPYRASKGFGFVEVEDPAQQQEAVDKVEGTLVGERKITAKIAHEMRAVEVEAVVEAEPEAAKAAGVTA